MKLMQSERFKNVIAAIAPPFVALAIGAGVYLKWFHRTPGPLTERAMGINTGPSSVRNTTDVLVGVTEKGEARIRELIKSKDGIDLAQGPIKTARVEAITAEISRNADGTPRLAVKGILIPWGTPVQRPSHELLDEITNLMRAELTSMTGGPGNYRMSFREDGFFEAADPVKLGLLW